MARTSIPLQKLGGNAADGNILDPTGVAIDQANGMVVSAGRFRKLLLRVNNSAAGSHNVIVRAGKYPPAENAGQGDLTVAVAAAATRWIGPFTGARFSQGNGDLNIDFDAGTTGTITAFQLPDRY